MRESVVAGKPSSKEVLAQIRADNSIVNILRQHGEGRHLTVGQQAKILHRLPQKERKPLQHQIREVQGDFWQVWTDFRCRPAVGWLRPPVFDDLVGLLPARKEFADFVGVKEGEMVVDLTAGAATMAEYFRGKKISYVAVDGNPLIEKDAVKQLASLDFPVKAVYIKDLSDGLPEELSGLIAQKRPLAIRYISNWGLTYLDAESIRSVARQCLDSRFNHGIPATLDINMMTSGKFDRDELQRRFREEIVPEQKKQGAAGMLRVIRAFSALPGSRKFADSWPLVMPMWYPDEMVEEVLKPAGLKVEAVNPELLWGQSTAIKITAG